MTSDFLRAPLRVLPTEPGCVIDCDTCTVRGPACDDCVVSVMLGGPPDVVAPDAQRALDVLAGAGFVPPLLMTPPPPASAAPPAAPPPPPAVPAGPPTQAAQPAPAPSASAAPEPSAPPAAPPAPAAPPPPNGGSAGPARATDAP
jgi:hypothetical protein